MLFNNNKNNTISGSTGHQGSLERDVVKKDVTEMEVPKREVLHLIEWKNNLKCYLYGTLFSYHGKGRISFENSMMPPGTVIQRWKSEYNYQGERHEPDLVPLMTEKEYRLRAYWDCEPEQGLLIKILFYDSLGKVIESVTDYGPELTFTCPQRCCSWELQLVNGGVRRFEFYYLELTPVLNSGRNWFPSGVPVENAALLFAESIGNSVICPDDRILGQIKNAVVIPVQYAENELMLQRTVLTYIQKDAVLIGYGPRGNRAVIKCVAEYGCRGFVSRAGIETATLHALAERIVTCYESVQSAESRRRVQAIFLEGMLNHGIVDYSNLLWEFPFEML